MLSEDFIKQGYRLVWHDEFEGDHLDHAKWEFGTENTNKAPVYLCNEDESPATVCVKDGMLRLKANMIGDHPRHVECPHIKYVTSRSISTKYTMNFKYGYVEMRAKVPHKKGGFPAFWAISKTGLVEPKNKNYFSEVDFFENFGTNTQMTPGFHKWYKDGTHVCPRMEDMPGYGAYKFKDPENICNEYHIYGFEWTPTEMKMYFDGECYTTFDTTFCFDKDFTEGNMPGPKTTDRIMTLPHDDMDEFNDHLCLLIQNLLLQPCEGNEEYSNNLCDDPDLFPYEYFVDYVRLYQKPGVGDIVYLEKKKI